MAYHIKDKFSMEKSTRKSMLLITLAISDIAQMSWSFNIEQDNRTGYVTFLVYLKYHTGAVILEKS